MARDLYHSIVKTALENEGWVVTHDPFRIPKRVIGAKLEIDLGLEKIIIAEKETERIAVEVKSFLKISIISEFHNVLGQYLNYEIGLEAINENRMLFVAIPLRAYQELAEMPIFDAVLAKFNLKIIVFEPDNQTIVSWIK